MLAVSPELMVRTTWIALIAALACCFGPLQLRGAVDRASLTNFDVRASAPRKALRAEQQLGQKKLQQSVPGARADFDPILQTPKWVHAGAGFLTGDNGQGGAVTPDTAKRFDGDADKALKGFLHEQRELFRHGPEVLEGATKKRDHATKFLRTAAWEQQLDGIPVFESILVAHTTSRGELISISSLFLPEPAKAADKGTPGRAAKAGNPDVAAERALRIAVENLGEEISEMSPLDAAPAAKTLKQKFQLKPLPGDATAGLVWFPLDGDTLRLCWDVELTRRERGERFRLVIDAGSGAVLLRRKLTVEISEVHYNVFTSDSPSPFSPGHSFPTNSQPPLVQRQLLSISNVHAMASPLGWINDGVLETRGNNVDAHVDRDGDDRADLPRFQGTTNAQGGRVFDYPLDLGQQPTNYSPASTVQLFYWCNWMHDKLYELGFTESAGNFQKDNFGRGGADNDAMLAQAQDGSGFNNANYTPAGDGAPGKIQMFMFNMTTPFRDGSLDAEVILHEYAHGLSDRLIAGGVGISQLQTFGMGEGWSDFYAEALLAEPGDNLGGTYPMSGYLTYLFDGLSANYYYGIRRYPYCTNLNVNPLTLKDIDPTRASSHPGVPRNPVITSSGNAVHRQGEVWGSMLWDMRAFLLRKYAPTNAIDYTNANMRILRYVTLGLQLSPPNPNFVQARDAIILQAMRVLQAGSDTNEAWAAFARRGLGLSAICPDSSTTVGVFESFDTPSQPEFDIQPRNTISFNGVFGGPFTGTAATTTLSSLSQSNVMWSAFVNVPWLQLSSVSGVLAPGIPFDCVASLAPIASTLPVGIHPGTIFFTNLARTQVLTRAVSLQIQSTNQPPDDVMTVSPTSTLLIQGPRGGPFTPGQRTQRITNTGETPFWWGAFTTNEWLSISPTNNIIDPLPDLHEAIIRLAPAATNLGEGAYAGAVTFVNSNSGARVDIPVSLRIGANDYLTEEFPPGQFDLQNTTLTFTPDLSPTFYAVCRTPAAQFPTEPAGGVAVTLADDAFQQVTLTNNRQVSLYGARTNALFIGANGHITFDPVIDTNFFYPGVNQYFAANRVAPLYVDLNPATGGTISYLQLSNRFVVTYENVPEFGVANVNNTQIELFYDGAIRLTWLRVDATNGQTTVAGLSRGGGQPADFVQTDLSASETCGENATLLLPVSMFEGDSQSGVLIFNAPTTNDLELTLFSSDPNEIFVEESLVIPAGSTSYLFPLTALDDGEHDGTQRATIMATIEERSPLSGSILVDDAQSSSVFVNVRPSGREGDILVAGGTVSSDVIAVRPITVSLFSDNTNRVQVPSSVVIPAGTNVATFTMVLPDNNVIQDTQNVHITAFIVNWADDADVIRVSDNESRALKLTLPPQVVEGQGSITNGGTVTFSGLVLSNTVVSLQSEISTLIAVPALVTNSAGKSNVSFSIVVSDNAVTNGFDTLRVTASATGFLSVTGSVNVIDDERPFEAINPSPVHLATDVERRPVLSWAVNTNAPQTTVYQVFFSTNADLSTVSPLISTTSRSTPLPFELSPDTTYYWRVVARLDPFPEVASAVWQFTTTPLELAFAPVESPQFTGEPFPISVIARDRFGLPVTNYSGSLTLTNFAPVKSRSTVVITEVESSPLRAVEFVNVSDRSLNIAGWQVVLYDLQNWPEPRAIFTIPGPSTAPPGGLFQLRNLPPLFPPPGSYPNFVLGTNLLWSHNAENNPVAVMLLDNVGNMVDFVCAFDANPALITIPQPVPASHWSGPPAPPYLENAFTLQRVGNHDTSRSNDWRIARRSTGTNNVGLVAPFVDTTAVSFSGTTVLNTFVSGVATGAITMLAPAHALVFGATETSGTANPRGAASNPIDVFTRNDISVTLTAPDGVLVGEPIRCRATVTNNGPLVANGVRLTDTISTNAQISAATPSQGACVLSNGMVICDLGSLNAGAFATIDVTASSVTRGSVTNFATVTRSGSDGFEANNHARAVTSVTFPQLAILDVTNGEPVGPFSMTFNVRLTTPYSLTCSVAYATSDGTATGGLDFQPATGTLEFPPGVTNRTILIPIHADSLSESNETFFVTLSNPKSVDFTRPIGIGTIQDNDAAPQVNVLDATVTESDAGSVNAVFEVRLNAPSGRIVTVAYRTGNDSALAGLDYMETYGVLTFPPGTTNRTVSVAVLGGTTVEPTKTFALNLTGAGNALIARGQGIGTILDNDVASLDHFTFNLAPDTNYIRMRVPFTLTARDGSGAVATGFNRPVQLMASANPRAVNLGTNATNWSLPLATSFHDARIQSIYWSNEIAGAGRILGLSLDVVTPPAQTLSNFTIRLRHTITDRYIGNAWETSNWIVACQRDLSIVSTGWTYIAFSTPFHYNGQDNLMVDFSFDNSSFSADGVCRSSPTVASRSLYLRTDSAYGRPTDWPLDGILNKPSGTSIARVPNVRLFMDSDIPFHVAGSNGFVNGIWSDVANIDGAAQTVVLRAVDAEGHVGESGPFTSLALRIVRVARSATEVTVAVETLPGKTYALESRSTLGGEWAHVETRAGNGSVLEFRHTPTGPRRFYRVRLVSP